MSTITINVLMRLSLLIYIYIYIYKQMVIIKLVGGFKIRFMKITMNARKMKKKT